MKRPPPWLLSHRPGTGQRERSVCVLKKVSGVALQEDKALPSTSKRALCLAGIRVTHELLWPQKEAAWCCKPRGYRPGPLRALLCPHAALRPGLPLTAPLAVTAATATQPCMPGPHRPLRSPLLLSPPLPSPHASHPYRHLRIPGLGTGRCLLTPAPLDLHTPRSKSCQTCSYPLLLLHHSPTAKLSRIYCRGLRIFPQPSHMIQDSATTSFHC